MHLNINVISDFRSRKTTPFYDSQDYSKSVNGMKIIPLQTSELKKIISNSKTYRSCIRYLKRRLIQHCLHTSGIMQALTTYLIIECIYNSDLGGV